jgi:hypothetical protein
VRAIEDNILGLEEDITENIGINAIRRLDTTITLPILLGKVNLRARYSAEYPLIVIEKSGRVAEQSKT